MDPVILILTALAVVIITTLFFLNKSKKEEKNEAAAVDGNRVEEREVRRPLPNMRNPGRNRLRNRNLARNNFADDLDEEELDNPVPVGNNDVDELVEGSDEEGQEWADSGKRIGTKKLAKMEEKAAKKERNLQMLREREEKKEREEQIYEERKKREEELERLEKAKEEEERKAKEEQEKRDYEEYLKLKEQFTVEEEGQDAALTEEDSQNLLQNFVSFIKDHKMVVLEDLAAEFKLKTQDAINRINMVQEMGLLTGVMDDRGKFIYISEEELLKVKRFIEQRGRVNIAELAKSSSQLINLKPEEFLDQQIEASV